MSEAFNDANIAPRLLEIAEECSANGLSFCARVEWAPFEGQTTAKREAAGKISASHEMVYLASCSNGNLDTMLFSLARAHRDGKLDLSRTMLAVWMQLEPHSPPQKDAEGVKT